MCELNTDAFLGPDRPTKYFHSYNDFLRFCFKDPVIPRYRIFAPGGDCIIPKTNILRMPKVVYQNLMLFTAHHQHCGETHIIERTMIPLFTGNFELSDEILKPVDEKTFKAVPKKLESRSLPHRFARRIRFETERALATVWNHMHPLNQ
jgi:hypothetical protein